MQALGGPKEDNYGGFEIGDWKGGFSDELLRKTMGEQVGKPFTMLLGREVLKGGVRQPHLL